MKKILSLGLVVLLLAATFVSAAPIKKVAPKAQTAVVKTEKVKVVKKSSLRQKLSKAKHKMFPKKTKAKDIRG